MAKRIKYQTVRVPLPNASPAGVAVSVALASPDKNYPFITGVWAKSLNLGGANYLEFGVADGNGDVRDMAPSSSLETNESVGASDKYTPILIKNDGRTIIAKVAPDVITANANGLAVFSFRLEETEEARPSMS